MAWENGLYRATGKDDLGRHYSLMLRIDLDDKSGALSNKRISCDAFEGRLPDYPDADQLVATNGVSFLGTFRSDELVTRAGPEELGRILYEVLPGSMGACPLAAAGVSRSAKRSVFLRLLAPAAPEDNRPEVILTGLTVEGRVGPSGPLKMSAERLGNALRWLTLKVDRVGTYPDPFDVTAPVTGGGRLTLEEALGKAGFTVQKVSGSDKVPAQEDWTLDQLRSLVATTPTRPDQAGDSLRRAGAFLSSYLMLVSRLANDPFVTGLMWDRDHRLSAAVFYGSLSAIFPAGDELAANYLFTLIHELGHSLDLPHAFDEHRLHCLNARSPTFMNYPQLYTGDGGKLGTSPFRGGRNWDDGPVRQYKKFWSDFAFQFDPWELFELRHGARADVLTGDKVTAYRGDFTNVGASLSIGGDAGAGLELTLTVRGDGPRNEAGRSPGLERFRPRAIFEFGEPVHVEARLRSRLREPRAFIRRLSVVSNGLSVAYETPDGRYLRYEPPCELNHLPDEKVLNSDPRAAEPDAFYKHVLLSAGPDADGLLAPGRYRVRAAYRYRDTLLLSNILTIHVRYPLPGVEDQIVPLIDSEVADFFTFRGVHGLSRAGEALDSVFGADPAKLGKGANRRSRAKGRAGDRHPLDYYRCAYEARMRAVGVLQFNRKGTRVERVKRGHGDALAWFRPAFGLNDLNDLNVPDSSKLDGLPYSNIELGKLGGLFYKTLVEAKEPALATALRARLLAVYERRGIPGAILDLTIPTKPPRARRAK